jgi:hypothetical protein
MKQGRRGVKGNLVVECSKTRRGNGAVARQACNHRKRVIPPLRFRLIVRTGSSEAAMPGNVRRRFLKRIVSYFRKGAVVLRC